MPFKSKVALTSAPVHVCLSSVDYTQAPRHMELMQVNGPVLQFSLRAWKVCLVISESAIEVY